ncbi:hypothetical protein [Pokkaliibacter plantistimulans]|nr:hypothetical protein [Pokkaliibacter plantistimulans]
MTSNEHLKERENRAMTRTGIYTGVGIHLVVLVALLLLLIPFRQSDASTVIEDLFYQLDSNHDEHLQPAEAAQLPGLKAAFSQLDKDNSKTLDLGEFKQLKQLRS